MASPITEEFELQPLGADLPEDIDYDLEYLVRNRSKQTISIQREPLNEATFESGFRPVKSIMKRNWYKSFIPPEPIRSSLLPPTNRRSCKKFIFIHLPIISWIWSYQYSYIFGDIMSGITVAIMHIPQGLAYALLAGLQPVYGLYASFVPIIIYSILGTSRHISVGTFAVVSLMVSNAISRVFESNELYHPCLNVSEYNYDYKIEEHNKTCGDLSVEIAVTVAFVSGLIMLLMGVLQLGFITIFLSESLISGYTTGAAVHVFTSQLKHIFGMTLDSSQSGFVYILKTWIEAIGQIFHWPDKINTATFIVSFISITVLIVFRVIDRKLLRKLKVPYCFYSCTTRSWTWGKTRWPIPLPAQLIVVIVATLISFLAKLNDRFDVAIVDDIPLGLPPVTTPKMPYMLLILQDAIVISVVTFSVSVSLAQVFAKQFDYTISPSQEFIAYGAMNIIGSLFGSLNTAGSLSRSTVQAVSGGKTQLVGFLSSTIILIVLVQVGSLFEPLPKAVLASIIWVALYGMFSQILDVWRYFKLSVPDMFIWIVVFLSTVLLGVDIGLGVGVFFSILVVVIKVILPKSSALGRARDTEIFRNTENFENVQIIPGVVVYRFLAPICFVNCKVFLSRLDLVCGVDRLASSPSETQGCIQSFFNKICKKRCDEYDVNIHTHNSQTSNLGGISRSRSFQHALKEDIIDNFVTKKPPPGSVHTLVLDCAPISFMDAMGVKTLQQLVLDFDHHGIQVLFAAMTKHNRDMLERVGFFDKCGKEWLFPSLQDAVNHALIGEKLHPGGEEQLQVTSNIDDEEEEHQNVSNNNTVSIDIPDEILDTPQTNN